MENPTFEEIAANPTRRMHTRNKLALLAPYFNNTQTLEQIAEVSGRTKVELQRWVRNDLSTVARALASRDNELTRLRELLAADSMSADELLALSDHYQNAVVGDVSVTELALILGRSIDEVQSHIDRLYHKVITKLRHKDELAEQFRTTMMKSGAIRE